MFTRGETIGIIGTGLMGSAIVERLLAAGFRVLGWDCDAARLAASGAEAAGSAAAVADACRGVLLSLPDSGVVAGVLQEMNGHLREGSLVLDTGTGEPGEAEAFARRLRSGGVAYLALVFDGVELGLMPVASLSVSRSLLGDAFTPTLGGDYARVGTLCATINALGLVVIWFAPDTGKKSLDP